MIDQRTVKTACGVEFHIWIEDIKPSERSPNEYFRVLWSVTEGKQTVYSSFIVKFTDPMFFTNKVTPYRDTEENTIEPPKQITKILLDNVVVEETTDNNINSFVEIFFAERPNGFNRYDGCIYWNHKGPFFSA